MLAASQEVVLQAGLEICCKPHLHPHIHSTEFISIHGGWVTRRMGEGDSKGATESTVHKAHEKKEILEKVQDDSNPFSHYVLPAAEACNSETLLGMTRTKTEGYASHYSSGRDFDVKTNQSLLDQSLQCSDDKRGKNIHIHNLHLATPPNQPSRDLIQRKFTSVWKMLTAYFNHILRHFTCSTRACPANLAVFLPWRHFYGLLWRRAGGQGGRRNGRPHVHSMDYLLCNR